MALDMYYNDSNTLFQGDTGISPCQGETILLLLLPFIRKKKEFVAMSEVNKHLHDNSWRYLYYNMVQSYPEVSLIGSPASNPEMVRTYLPPRIILFPDFSPEMMLPSRGTRTFPMPESQQPKIHCDPRITDSFGSMTWSEKTKAIWEYAAKVEFWFSSVTTPRAEEHKAFAVSAMAMEQGRPVQDMICVLCQGLVLNRDLENYPFFLQCLNQDEASKVKVCFYERIIKVYDPDSSARGWSLLLSQALLKSLSDLSLVVSFD